MPAVVGFARVLAAAMLAAEAWAALVAARYRLRCWPFDKLRRRILAKPGPDSCRGSARRRTLGRVRVALLRAQRWLPWRAVCFDRALAGFILLRRRGIRVRIVYGAATVNAGEGVGRVRDLVGHVWLCDGDLEVLGDEGAGGIPKLASLTPVEPADEGWKASRRGDSSP